MDDISQSLCVLIKSSLNDRWDGVNCYFRAFHHKAREYTLFSNAHRMSIIHNSQDMEET